RARSFSAAARASANSPLAWARVSSRSFLCSSRSRADSARLRSASASCSSSRFSRASTAPSSAGQANRLSTRNRSPKTTSVQIMSPPFTTSGPLASPPSWATAGTALSSAAPRPSQNGLFMACTSERDLALHQQRDDGHEQRDAFNQRGEDQAGRLDSRTVLRLPGHPLGRRATDPPDSDTGAKHGESGAQS